MTPNEPQQPGQDPAGLRQRLSLIHAMTDTQRAALLAFIAGYRAAAFDEAHAEWLRFEEGRQGS